MENRKMEMNLEEMEKVSGGIRRTVNDDKLTRNYEELLRKIMPKPERHVA